MLPIHATTWPLEPTYHAANQQFRLLFLVSNASPGRCQCRIYTHSRVTIPRQEHFEGGQQRILNFRHGRVLVPSWRSGKVSIVIRRYQDGSYNAEVFNQRCKACNKLGILDLDQQTYIERVAYRLLKWAEVAVERPRYDSKETPPHRADLCEGCKRGICRDVGS